MSIGVGILGGTGFGAGELLRLLTFHREAEVVSITSRSSAGELVSTSHPHLLEFYNDLRFAPELEIEKFASYDEKYLFSALPHDVSAKEIAKLFPTLKEHQIKVIDLSGAHRLQDEALHTTHYPTTERDNSLTPHFTYGLSECFKEEIAHANFIANPGCLATASILSLAPIVHLIDPTFIAFDTKTGSSGSGRELKSVSHHPTRHGNFTAYKALAHQHEPEIMQSLKATGLQCDNTSFIAQSLPIARGIFVTTHIANNTSISKERLQDAFEQFAAHSPFIRLRDTPPHLQHLNGTNFCDISFAVRENNIIVMSAIDNLVKGMAGQAIQNMNLMAGLNESTGLMHPGMRPY